MSELTLTDFLLARIAEDEKAARQGRAIADPMGDTYGVWAAPEVGSERVPGFRPGVYDRVPTRYVNEDAEDLLALLALPYAEHPDYQESWRP